MATRVGELRWVANEAAATTRLDTPGSPFRKCVSVLAALLLTGFARRAGLARAYRAPRGKQLERKEQEKLTAVPFFSCFNLHSFRERDLEKFCPDGSGCGSFDA